MGFSLKNDFFSGILEVSSCLRDSADSEWTRSIRRTRALFRGSARDSRSNHRVLRPHDIRPQQAIRLQEPRDRLGLGKDSTVIVSTVSRRELNN